MSCYQLPDWSNLTNTWGVSGTASDWINGNTTYTWADWLDPNRTMSWRTKQNSEKSLPFQEAWCPKEAMIFRNLSCVFPSLSKKIEEMSRGVNNFENNTQISWLNTMGAPFMLYHLISSWTSYSKQKLGSDHKSLASYLLFGVPEFQRQLNRTAHSSHWSAEEYEE